MKKIYFFMIAPALGVMQVNAERKARYCYT
jgi:hypothetical protein